MLPLAYRVNPTQSLQLFGGTWSGTICRSDPLASPPASLIRSKSLLRASSYLQIADSGTQLETRAAGKPLHGAVIHGRNHPHRGWSFTQVVGGLDRQFPLNRRTLSRSFDPCQRFFSPRPGTRRDGATAGGVDEEDTQLIRRSCRRWARVKRSLPRASRSS